MKKTKVKMPTRIRVNIAILVVMAVIFAVMPSILFQIWFNNNETVAQYGDSFAYILHDICPCSADEEDCLGYYACGPDKANITYNLDTAPADQLAEAKRDHYFETLFDSVRHNTINIRRYIVCDICYFVSVLFLVAGVIYWNHNKAKA